MDEDREDPRQLITLIQYKILITTHKLCQKTLNSTCTKK